MKSNIVLIGFMGTGKTTVGKILAQKLKKKFNESDEEIVKKTGKDIPRIFSEEGEVRFREIETELIKELSVVSNMVLSLGGGAVLNKVNMINLQPNSFIVLLEAPAKDIYARILSEGKEKRPLLNKPEPLQEIQRLLKIRKPFYTAFSDICISTHNKTPEQVAKEIVDIFIKSSD
jgi:shikimate kinase